MTEHPHIETLSAYLDGALEEHEQRRAAQHLGECVRCTEVVRELQQISLGLQALLPENPPVDLAARVVTLLDSPRPVTYRHRNWHRRLPSAIGAAASVLLGLLIGFALAPGQAVPDSPGLGALVVLGSAPPGAICARPESCYLKVSMQ